MCKLLRREILRPAFVRRVCREPDGIVPPWLLGFLGETFSLVHPATPAAASFAKSDLVPFVSRSAGDLLEPYVALTTRGGLVVLERRYIDRKRNRSWERASSDLCVYDPMTGGRTFLPSPPDIGRRDRTYVLLTAADGIIGCSFLLLAADLGGLEGSSRRVRVQTLSSDAGGKWGAVARAGDRGLPRAVPVSAWGQERYDEAVVLGGVVHWLVREYVLTYDVATAAVGRIRLPRRCDLTARALRLGSTPDGKLRLLGAYRGFTVCSWVMSADGWSRRGN